MRLTGRQSSWILSLNTPIYVLGFTICRVLENTTVGSAFLLSAAFQDSFLLSCVTAEKQRDVQRAGGGGRGRGPDERGVLQDSDGRHRGAPGGGGAGVRKRWKQRRALKLISSWNFSWSGERRLLQCKGGKGPEEGLVSPERTKTLDKSDEVLVRTCTSFKRTL